MDTGRPERNDMADTCSSRSTGNRHIGNNMVDLDVDRGGTSTDGMLEHGQVVVLGTWTWTLLVGDVGTWNRRKVVACVKLILHLYAIYDTCSQVSKLSRGGACPCVPSTKWQDVARHQATD
jgi:hypothetical protein